MTATQSEDVMVVYLEEALKNCERLCDQLQKAAERPLHPSANRAKTLAHDAGKIQNTLRALVDASRQRRLGG